MPLIADDYQNIRRVTNFFIERGSTATFEETLQVLSESHFDPRLFSGGMSEGGQDGNDSLEIINAIELNEYLANAKILGRMPNKCSFVELRQNGRSCNLDYQKSKDQFALQLSIPEFHISLGSNFEMFRGGLHKTHDNFTKRIFYSMTIPTPDNLKNAPVGTKKRFESLIFEKSTDAGAARFRLKGFISVSAVMTRIENRKGRRFCYFERLKPSSLSEDSVIAVFEPQDLAILKNRTQETVYINSCD